MASTRNPEARAINQKRGPTTGNGGITEKRKTFIAEKKDSGNERTRLADFVMSALEGRGKGMKPSTSATTEPLDADRGPKNNPTAGGTKYNVRTKTAGKITK